MFYYRSVYSNYLEKNHFSINLIYLHYEAVVTFCEVVSAIDEIALLFRVKLKQTPLPWEMGARMCSLSSKSAIFSCHKKTPPNGSTVLHSVSK
jgi:hypothetical protein